jgi:hypothetical protein
VTIEMGPAALILEVPDLKRPVKCLETAKRYSLEVGDMGAGEERTLLFRLQLLPHEPGAQAVARVRSNFTDILHSCLATLEATVMAAREQGPLPPGAVTQDSLVSENVCRVLAASALERGNALAREGRHDEAREALAGALAVLSQSLEHLRDQRAVDAVMEFQRDLLECERLVGDRARYVSRGHARVASVSMQHYAQRGGTTELGRPSRYCTAARADMAGASSRSTRF